VINRIRVDSVQIADLELWPLSTLMVAFIFQPHMELFV